MPLERVEALKSLLDMFVSLTNLPIGLYEIHNGKIEENGIFSNLSLEKFEQHCQLIHSFPGGKSACEADQCNRAKQGVTRSKEHLSLCHAGIYNQIVPVKVKGKVRAILLYGEMHIDGQEYRKKSLKKHRSAVKTLQLTDSEALQLHTFFHQVKAVSTKQIKTFKKDISRVVEWFYILLDQEEELKHNAEQVRHELQIRLTALIAHASILAKEISNLGKEDAQRRANLLLNNAKAFQTVVNSLDHFIEEYFFVRAPIEPLINEVKLLYEAEANHRYIDIYLELQNVDGQQPIIEFSRHHIQHVLSNLLHNAVKYSFRGRPERHRYIRITGKSTGEYYRITFSNYGVGISEEEISNGKIFEDGYQGNLTQHEYRTGSGKGLYFVKKVIHDHNGKIEAKSELLASDVTNPEGLPHLTQFHIYLPFRQPRG